MKLLEYKQFNNADEVKKLNKKKVAITGIIMIIILAFTIISVSYIASSDVRNFMDKYILFKSVSENNLPYINIEDEDVYVYAYHNYIAVLENNKLLLYNSSAKVVEELVVNVSTPIFTSNGNYFIVAEKNGDKAYLIKDKKIIWEKNVEGDISRVNVNENGYVSIVVAGTSHKSVILTYSEDGNELFKTFLSNKVVIDVDISKDNKYLSFCEIDLSGPLLENKVKTILIEDAKNNNSNSIVETYEIPTDSLVINLEYHGKGELLCMCDKQIFRLKNGNLECIDNLDNTSITFSGIKLSNSYFKLCENIQGINHQDSNVEIYNTSNHNKYLYVINGIAKSVYTYNKIIAVNMSSEVYFISEKGWLIKQYKSSREVKDVILSDNIAGIVYRDKIEIIDL